MCDLNNYQMLGQESHEEATEELPSKAKFFFSTAVEAWDAEFYVKVEDNINLDLGNTFVFFYEYTYISVDFSPSPFFPIEALTHCNHSVSWVN